MGYRSEVGLALSKNGVKKMEELMQDNLNKDNAEERNYLFNNPDKHFQDEDESELFIWSWIKWYDSFLDVGSVESLMRCLDDKDYKFVRIGEESGDIEEIGDFYDNPFELGHVTNLYYTG